MASRKSDDTDFKTSSKSHIYEHRAVFCTLHKADKCSRNALDVSIQEVPGLNLGRVTGYPDLRSSWFSSDG
jgi:hypothetical protein